MVFSSGGAGGRILPPSAGLLSAAALVAVLLVAGNAHYKHKYREVLTIQTAKPLERPLTIVMASDLHIGYHNRRAELACWVDLINAEQPDLVLFGGDIIDRSIRAVEEGGFAAEFRRIAAPVYAIPGNHEYYSDLTRAQLSAPGTPIRSIFRLYR